MNTQNTYYLMRHGESLANRRGLIVSHEKNALHDYGLTARGAEQVMQAALSTRLGIDTLIVTSDYKRALDTAEIVHSVLGCKTDLSIEPLLRERNFGDWELADHQNYEHVWSADASQPERRHNNVELIKEVLERAKRALKKLETLHQGKKILLVGHGDVLQILLSYYHGIDPRFHRTLRPLGNADIRSLKKVISMMNNLPAA